MHFAISLLNFRPGQVGGVETYVRKLLRSLPAVAGGDTLTLVVPRHVVATLDAPGWRLAIVELGDRQLVAARIAEAMTPWRARGVERAIEELRLDAMLFPQQSIFPRTVRVPAVLTVVDVQHLFFPENFGLFDRTFRAAIYPYSLGRARRIIAISQTTRKTLIERAGMPPEKIEAVPFGFSPEEGGVQRPLEGVPGPYLYYPAATFPHKNHAALFRSYAALRARGDVAEPLVLTGVRTGLWKKLERLIRELRMEDHIRHLGYLSYADVRRVYAGASAVVLPTLFEGFGLPVLEAVELGKKVIVSRLGIFDEVGVPPRFQIDFSDPAQLAAALRLPGPTSLAVRPSTWEDNARATLRELRRAAGHAP